MDFALAFASTSSQVLTPHPNNMTMQNLVTFGT